MTRLASRQMQRKANAKNDCSLRPSRRHRWSRPIALLAALVIALVPLPAGDAAEAILVGAGDIAKCGKRLPGAEATAKLLDEILSANPAGRDGASGKSVDTVVFTLGDNAYRRGTAKEFQECYEPTWGRHKEHTRPAVGNHEYKTPGASPYYDYFGPAAGDPDKGYYSYDLGEWHIIVLNSNCKKIGGCNQGSAQHQWLVNDLKTNTHRCSLAYAHHPAFSSGKHGGSKAVLPIFETLYEYHVDLLLAGHEHHYERFAPQNPQGTLDLSRGIRQFVVGTGGREHRRIGRPKPHSEVRDRSSYGVLKLTLLQDGYDWAFIPVEGATFQDSGTGKCH